MARAGRRAFARVAAAMLSLPALWSCAPEDERAVVEKPLVDPTSVRRLPQGEIVGFTGRYGSHVWLGIPYARPPVGERRWREPGAAPRWEGRFEALAFGSPCPQLATPFAGVVDQEPGTYAGAEDCLYLNVYAPQLAPDALPDGDDRLPVMVWIHGGGNAVGHASYYDGGNLARTENVIVVTINYRIGPLGWFRHAALRAQARNAREASGNFGTLDQIHALRWVRDQIGGFGGDPDNVTVFGESAGGRNVLALLLSPPAEGLFHRAIAQSGSARRLPLREAEAFADAPEPGHRNSSNEVLVSLLVRSGRAPDRSAALVLLENMDAEQIAAFLRETDPERLLRAYETGRHESIADVPNVFGDGTVLPAQPPLERFAAGDFNRVPVLLGTNRDENKIFMFASSEHVWRILGFLPRLRDEAAFNRRAAAISTAWKLVGADAPADAMRRGGLSQIYVYRWDWDEEPRILGADLSVMIGASHGFEIPFVFGHYELGEADVVWTPENQPGREELSAAMMSYWTEFARSGNPLRGRRNELRLWKPWRSREGAPKFMILDTAAGGGLRMESEALTPGRLVESVRADYREAPEAERCEAFVDVDAWLQYIGLAFPDLGRCAAMLASR